MTDSIETEVAAIEKKRASVQRRIDKLHDELREWNSALKAAKRKKTIVCKCGNSVVLGKATVVREKHHGYRECGDDRTEYQQRIIWVCQKCALVFEIPEEESPPDPIGDWYSDNGFHCSEKVREYVKPLLDRRNAEYANMMREIELDNARRVLRRAGELK